MKLRFMTYNTSHGQPIYEEEPTISLELLADVIRKSDADIVVLNEIYGRVAGSELFPAAQAEKIAAHIGYHCYFARSVMLWGNHPYGNAILSKYPIVETKIYPVPEPVKPYESPYYEDRSVCRCVVEFLAEGEIRQVAVYASHYGLSPAEHKCAVETTLGAMEGETLPYVFMGDLNMQPDNEIMNPLFEKMTDTACVLEGDCFTFPADKPEIKIDYIFTSDQMKPVYSKVIKTFASDHRPLICDAEVHW